MGTFIVVKASLHEKVLISLFIGFYQLNFWISIQYW